MPAAKIQATVTQQVKIAPRLATRLMNKLREYQTAHTAAKIAEGRKTALRVEIEDVLGDIGETNIKLQGFSTCLTAQPRRTLSVSKLMAAGVSLDLINDCYDVTTSKPYVKISCPGVREIDPEGRLREGGSRG